MRKPPADAALSYEGPHRKRTAHDAEVGHTGAPVPAGRSRDLEFVLLGPGVAGEGASENPQSDEHRGIAARAAALGARGAVEPGPERSE
jgi:hypothetical protein